MINRLRRFVDHSALVPYLCSHTPAQLAAHFSTPTHSVYIKRDDYLGSALCSGTKARKWASLLPYILRKQQQQQQTVVAVVEGSLASNHILMAVQLLKSHRVPFRLRLTSPRPPPRPFRGNALFTSMLLSERELEDALRGDVEGGELLVIPEGASHPQSVPGLLTLPLSIMRNEEEERVRFDDIWVEAGTGATAAALVAGLAMLGDEIPRSVHVVHCAVPTSADPQQVFARDARRLLEQVDAELATIGDSGSVSVRVWSPVVGRAFGSVPRASVDTVRRWAERTGVLLDLVYGAKMLQTFEHWSATQDNRPRRQSLIIHSGGAQSLTGFEHKL
ncbi:hypothetical protein RI367_006164 [Sorochytrium milnesiophthora]